MKKLSFFHTPLYIKYLFSAYVKYFIESEQGKKVFF